ncbi:phage tailspike protein, partial [Escherichia coli]
TYINTPETHFSGLIKPTVDNVNSNGTSAFRWSQVYAGTGSINTSNEELKLRIEADEKTTESERLAALEIKENIWRFKFKDAVKI